MGRGGSSSNGGLALSQGLYPSFRTPWCDPRHTAVTAPRVHNQENDLDA